MRFVGAKLQHHIEMRKVMKPVKQKKIASKKRMIAMVSVAAFIFSANAQGILVSNNETFNAQEVQTIIATTVADAMSDVKHHLQEEKEETLPKLALAEQQLEQAKPSEKVISGISE